MLCLLQEARNSLKQVLPAISEVADADLAGTDDENAAQLQQHLKPRGLEAPLDCGRSCELCLDYQADTVRTIALVPGPQGDIDSSTLWVALEQKVEFLVGCQSSNTSEIPTEEVRQHRDVCDLQQVVTV